MMHCYSVIFIHFIQNQLTIGTKKRENNLSQRLIAMSFIIIQMLSYSRHCIKMIFFQENPESQTLHCASLRLCIKKNSHLYNRHFIEEYTIHLFSRSLFLKWNPAFGLFFHCSYCSCFTPMLVVCWVYFSTVPTCTVVVCLQC